MGADLELRLHRNEENVYELRLGNTVLASSIELSDMVSKAETFAKKFGKKLYISKAAISDWYVGFSENKEQIPEVFFDPYYPLKVQASLETSYRFVEGPFLDKEEALAAAFKISGKKAKVLDAEIQDV